MPRILKNPKPTLQAKTKPAKSNAKTLVGKRASSKAALASAGAKKSAARKPAVRKKAPGFHGGSYLTPKGNVSLGIPSFWTLRQTNDDLEVESPTGKTTVIVTAFQRTDGGGKLDAREYLASFLRSAPVKGRSDVQKNGHGRAMSRFRDLEGDRWQVEFLTDGSTLLLATMNTSLPARSQEAKVASQVLATLRLK